jgi:CheY-like chemotaxis protein
VKRILVVEDDPGIAFGLRVDLKTEGYDVELESDGESALQRATKETFDLILLDVMLPGKDGFEVCRELRRGGSKTPIILLTAKAQEAEKVMGLELGADDYVTKPFSPRELRARVKAALRRTGEDQSQAYRFGDLEVDFTRCGGPASRWSSRPSSSSCSPRLCATGAGSSAESNCWISSGGPAPSSPTAWWTTTSSRCGKRSSLSLLSPVMF